MQTGRQANPENQDGKKKSVRKKSGLQHGRLCLTQPRPSANQICLPRPPQNNRKKNERSSKNLVFKIEEVGFKKSKIYLKTNKIIILQTTKNLNDRPNFWFGRKWCERFCGGWGFDLHGGSGGMDSQWHVHGTC
jgi:hypothetical protein